MIAKRFIAGIMACAICLSVMTACGSAEDNTETAAASAAAAETTESKAETSAAETTVTTTAAKTESKEETTTAKPADESSSTPDSAAEVPVSDEITNEKLLALFDKSHEEIFNEKVEDSKSELGYIEMDGSTGTANLTADRDCLLIAAAYEEDAAAQKYELDFEDDHKELKPYLLYTAMTKVSAGSKSAVIKFGGKLPEFYFLRAFLVDAADFKPLDTETFSTEHEIDIDKYFEENTTLHEVKDVVPEEMLSEAEAIEFLTKKGFTDHHVTYDHTADCKLVDDQEASADSSDKHPCYRTSFTSKANVIWNIDIVGKTITGTPLYWDGAENLWDQDLDLDSIYFAETDRICSFYYLTKKFYISTPNESVGQLQMIDEINAETLDKITAEELTKLCESNLHS